jgi:glycosyltransferase involved in cell wall biosynthesis
MAAGLLWKGAGLLLEIIRRTADLPLQWNLFGTVGEETSALVEQLCSQTNVHFHGRVSLQRALSKTDVLLHLSVAFDPYPTVLLEAARAGLPAIATRTGGSPEIVEDGVTGLLVPPGDCAALEEAIRHFVAQPEICRQMGAAARLRFEERFRVERMVADYFSFWNGLRAAKA